MSSVNFRFVIVFITCIFLNACNTVSPNLQTKVQDPDARPEWIDSPGDGVSASAGMHIRGKVAQEELAIFRARTEYAKRFGVTIEAEQVMGMTHANGRATSSGASLSTEVVKQDGVKAQIKAKWRDSRSDVLWVWLVPSKN